jgi:hypothetical protein
MRERREKISLDIIGWKTSVVQRFEEEFNGLKKVCIGVNDRMLDSVTVKESNDFWKHLELVDGRLALLTS